MIGDRGKLLFQRGRTDWLTSPASLLADFDAPEPTLPRVPNEDAEWLAACAGGPPALSHFDYSGPLTEFVLLGNLAIRLGTPIEWDGAEPPGHQRPRGRRPDPTRVPQGLGGLTSRPA